MQAQITPWDSSKAIGITFTDKPVIAFGGVALFVVFARRIGLAPKLAEALSRPHLPALRPWPRGERVAVSGEAVGLRAANNRHLGGTGDSS